MAEPAAEPAAAATTTADADAAEAETAMRMVSTSSREKVGALLSLVRGDRWDVAAWHALLGEITAWPVAAARSLYEEAVGVFPMGARVWVQYVEAEIKAGNQARVKALFGRCLLTVLDVALWRAYLKLIAAESKSADAAASPAASPELRQAYEFALTHLGEDVTAGEMWREYLLLLRSSQPQVAQERGAWLTSLRRAYQRAVLTPMEGADALWREWELFETNEDRTLAKALLAEYQPKHVSAKGALRERKRLRERIDAQALAVPPQYASRVHEAAAGDANGAALAADQASAWADLIAYERSNPQRLDDEAHTARLAFTYNQSLLALGHYPRVWLELHALHASAGDNKGAKGVLTRAVRAVPGCLLLHFALADYEEGRGKMTAARAVYDALVAQPDTLLSGERRTLAYIALMRFARRAEGAESARKVFLAARKDAGVSYHVFVASALMEYRVGKDAKVARNIFELGLRTHLTSAGYVLAYADFLSDCLNDDNNTRSLFERTLAADNLPAAEARRVWNGFLAFESAVGNTVQYQAVQARRAEALREAMQQAGTLKASSRGGGRDAVGAPGSAEDALGLMLQRHAFEGLNAATPREAGLTAAQCEALGLDSAGFGVSAAGGDVDASGDGGGTSGGAGGAGSDGQGGQASSLTGALGTLVAVLAAEAPQVTAPLPQPEVVISVALQQEVPVPIATSAASRIRLPVTAESQAAAAAQVPAGIGMAAQQRGANGGQYGLPPPPPGPPGPPSRGGGYDGYDDRDPRNRGGGGGGGGGGGSGSGWSNTRKYDQSSGSGGGGNYGGSYRERERDSRAPEHVDVFRHRRGGPR